MDTKEMRKSRKNIDILQVAATDKENLSRKIAPKKKMALSQGNGRIRLGKKEGKVIETGSPNVVELKNNINKMKNENSQKKANDVIVASDLTSDSPGEKYWEKMAESRRVALESALKENVDLTNKLSEVEYENARLKEMLKEAQTLVEVLTEMLEGNNSDDMDGQCSKEEDGPQKYTDDEVDSVAENNSSYGSPKY